MDDLQKQIFELKNQLCRLNQTMESMPKLIVAGLLTSGAVQISGVVDYINRESLESSFTHKDILIEGSVSDDAVYGGESMPCEWQVGRLTAQLISAYERIAALEEQLVSRHLASR